MTTLPAAAVNMRFPERTAEAPRRPRCNMDVLLAAVESLRLAELNGYHSRAGKIQKVHVKRKRGIFKCDKCPSVFGLRHNLLRHDRTIHQGRRPFKCRQPDCNASFVQRFDLETHRSSVHDKRKDYQCTQCDRSFSQRSNLHTHVRLTHQAHTLEELPCDLCDKTFKTRSNLKQHMFAHSAAMSSTTGVAEGRPVEPVPPAQGAAPVAPAVPVAFPVLAPALAPVAPTLVRRDDGSEILSDN